MILVLRRLVANSRCTLGQLSAGEKTYLTREAPLTIFRQPGPMAVASGQYLLRRVGDEWVLEGYGEPLGALGRRILYGVSMCQERLLKQTEAAAALTAALASATGRGEAVLLDVADPKERP